MYQSDVVVDQSANQLFWDCRGLFIRQKSTLREAAEYAAFIDGLSKFLKIHIRNG